MARMIIGSLVAALSVGVVGLTPAESGLLANREDSVRNLLLNAAGTRTPKPGQIRIPILVEGAAYEVFVAKPGEPKASPVAKNDAD